MMDDQATAFREQRTNDQLASDHLPMVWHQAYRFAKFIRRGSDSQATVADELASVGMLTMAKCLRRFDRSRGFRFSTYLCLSLQNEFARHLRLTKQQKQRGLHRAAGSAAILDVDASVSLDSMGGRMCRQTVLRHTRRHGESATIEDVESVWRDSLRGLPARDVDAIVWRYLHGEKLLTIGQRMGISRERVRQLLLASAKAIRQTKNLRRGVLQMAERE